MSYKKNCETFLLLRNAAVLEPTVCVYLSITGTRGGGGCAQITCYCLLVYMKPVSWTLVALLHSRLSAQSPQKNSHSAAE